MLAEMICICSRLRFARVLVAARMTQHWKAGFYTIQKGDESPNQGKGNENMREGRL